MKTRLIITLLLLVVTGLPGLRAEPANRPFVCPLFCDNMVLQRDQPDPVWGWTTPGQEVTVTIGTQSAKATADASGKWLAKLTPPPAGGPYEMTVSGPQTLTLHNVLVGDVWFCSGQSNMDFGIGQADNAEQEIAAANQPQIRLFMVGKKASTHPLDEVKGGWKICTPESVAADGWKGFSAVGYFFGLELHEKLNVPIGLIQAAVGATPAEAWTGAESMTKAMPEMKPSLDQIQQIEAMFAGKTEVEKRQIVDNLRKDWFAQVAIPPAISTPEFDASSWKVMPKLPGRYTDEKDPELKNFHGAIIFRKEILLPDGVAEKAAELNLSGADEQDVAWVNGIQVGTAQGGNPQHFKLAPGTLKPGRNVIAIWLLNTTGPGGIIGKPEDLSLKVEGSEPVSLAGDWQYQLSTPNAKLPPSLFNVPGSFGFATEIFNGMVAPVAPFGIKGVIWYQGEANVGRASRYRTLLTALIESWHDRWQQGNFPFLIVQLPNFGGGPGRQPSESNLAVIRESQAVAAKAAPSAGLAVTIDLGEPGNLHPPHKKEVAHRLALVARAQVYGEAVPSSGPVFESIKRDGEKLRITFSHAEGLHPQSGPDVLGFAVAGEDHVFHWASATIDGESVVVTSPAVAAPTDVRYDWNDSPKGNLYNQADLPAMPFRTDAEAAAQDEN